MTLDWPAGFERTPPYERERYRSFEATLGQTTDELAAEMDRLDPDDWRPSIANQHTKSNGLPLHNANPDDPGFVLRWTKDGDQFAVACDASPRLRDNVRWIYKWIHETRMRNQRPVQTGAANFAAAQLPSGDEDGVVVATAGAHDVLGVDRDASDEEIRAAFRERVKDVHPDHGGDAEAYGRVVKARDRLLGGDE